LTAYRDKLNAGHYAPPKRDDEKTPPKPVAAKPKPKPVAAKKSAA
jgi:hypothetical protein